MYFKGNNVVITLTTQFNNSVKFSVMSSIDYSHIWHEKL